MADRQTDVPFNVLKFTHQRRLYDARGILSVCCRCVVQWRVNFPCRASWRVSRVLVAPQMVATTAGHRAASHRVDRADRRTGHIA